jgi:hypothetical protein
MGGREKTLLESMMVVSRTAVLVKPSREGRQRGRQKLGRLSANVVKAGTLTRYRNSVLVFLGFVQNVLEKRLRSYGNVDVAAFQFIEELWQEGEGMKKGSYLLAALQFFELGLRRNLVAAWRLFKGMEQAGTVFASSAGSFSGGVGSGCAVPSMGLHQHWLNVGGCLFGFPSYRRILDVRAKRCGVELEVMRLCSLRILPKRFPKSRLLR